MLGLIINNMAAASGLILQTLNTLSILMECNYVDTVMLIDLLFKTQINIRNTRSPKNLNL